MFDANETRSRCERDFAVRQTSLSGQRRSQPRVASLVFAARLECRRHIHCDETGKIVRLHLRDAIHVGADHRADHGVTAAGYGVTMQDDRLKPAGHLDRAVRVAGVDDIRRIRPGAERLLALAKSQRPPLAVAIADAVRFRRDRPRVLKKILGRLVGEPAIARREGSSAGARSRVGR